MNCEKLLTGRQLFAKLSEEDVFLDDFEIYRNDAVNAEDPYWERMYPSCEVEFILKTPLLFRYVPKQRFIRINGIKVPAPFKPKEGDSFWYLDSDSSLGYSNYVREDVEEVYQQFGAWRAADEIKQVVEALRSVFNGELK